MPIPCNVLRITATTADNIVLKLEGRLVGPWVDELRQAVLRTDQCSRLLQIDVSELRYADEEGAAVLCWLHRQGARFEGRGPFADYLFKRLRIPLFPPRTEIRRK
jgi:ABC-type transporter Mla MlaB component